MQGGGWGCLCVPHISPCLLSSPLSHGAPNYPGCPPVQHRCSLAPHLGPVLSVRPPGRSRAVVQQQSIQRFWSSWYWTGGGAIGGHGFNPICKPHVSLGKTLTSKTAFAHACVIIPNSHLVVGHFPGHFPGHLSSFYPPFLSNNGSSLLLCPLFNSLHLHFFLRPSPTKLIWASFLPFRHLRSIAAPASPPLPPTEDDE